MLTPHQNSTGGARMFTNLMILLWLPVTQHQGTLNLSRMSCAKKIESDCENQSADICAEILNREITEFLKGIK